MTKSLADQIEAMVDVTISDDFSLGYNTAVKAAAALAEIQEVKPCPHKNQTKD